MSYDDDMSEEDKERSRALSAEEVGCKIGGAIDNCSYLNKDSCLVLLDLSIAECGRWGWTKDDLLRVFTSKISGTL